MATSTKPRGQATRTLQTLRGTGKVFERDEFLCEARYSVSVNQAIVYAGSQPSAGVTDIRGTLVIVNGERDWKLGTKLSLRMEDGRTATFTTSTDKPGADYYGIEVSALSTRQ